MRLEQGRVKGCRFRTAVFTNLTQDHLDYHGTMEATQQPKDCCSPGLAMICGRSQAERTYAVLNADDAASAQFAKLTSAEVLTYGIDSDADVRASDIKITAHGTSFQLDSFRGQSSSQPADGRQV